MSSLQMIEKVDKPWGYELIWAKTKNYVGKILHINKGHRLSLQYHKVKEETLYLQTGRMTLLFEDHDGSMIEVDMKPGDAHHIPVGRKHRMIAIEDCDVFEVYTPQLDDVVRIEDGYGRVEPAKK
jgi:mannose-6-phosphate isomerase-like protein (cupin superfamily)